MQEQGKIEQACGASEDTLNMTSMVPQGGLDESILRYVLLKPEITAKTCRCSGR